jgi:hypothetical protein
MGLTESLKDFYYKMQDKYYGLLDALEKRGVPVYKAVDALESRNIPSFPVAILLVVLIIAVIASFITQMAIPATGVLDFAVQDSENVVSGAEVTVFFVGEEKKELTDYDGLAQFVVPVGETVNYIIAKEGYREESGSRLITSSREEVSATLEFEIGTVTKTVQLMDGEGIHLITEPVVVSFSCSDNSDYSETKNVTSGIITAELPSDCGNLVVDVAGSYEPENPSADISVSGAIEIRLSDPEVGRGSANLFVNDGEGSPLPGIEVYLVRVSESGNTLQTIGPKTTTSLGSASFTNLPEGIYCFTTYDPQGIYAEFDSCSADEKEDVVEDSTTEFSAEISRRSIGKINVIVKEKSALTALEGAQVTLYRDGTEVMSLITGEDGKAEFTVGENVPYDVSVDLEGYLIETLSAINPAEDYYQALLSEATLENSRSLKVKVVDERKEPVEDVRARLMDLSDLQVGDELLTGTDGIAIFDRLEEGTYKVYVSKPGFDEQYSSEIAVTGRIENSVELALRIGRGSVEVSVYDEKGEPLPGANVKIIDLYSGEERNSRNTNKDGIAIFSERADKTVYARINSPEKSTYTTIPVSITKDITKRLSAAMQKAIMKLSVEETGIFVGGEVLQKPYALNPGQSYTIKFRLQLPEGAIFDEAGLHIRTGSDESSSMDKDEIYITDVTAAYDFARKGATYNPPLGYPTDLKNLTKGDAKWVNAVISNPIPGVYEAEAEIVVKDSAKQQSKLEIHYRGYARAGGYLRDPKDDELGRNESVATRQGLYANTKAIIASVGPSSLCDSDFCSEFLIENLDSKIRTYVVDDYSVDAMGSYRLLISGIVKQSEGIISDAELRISDARKGLAFGNYSIKTATGLTKGGDAGGSEFSISAGSIESGSVIGGEADGVISYVDFSPEKEGISKISISLVSAEGEVVFEKVINIEVRPPKELRVNIVPKMIVPYIENNLLINVTTGDGLTPVADAAVSIIKDGFVLDTGRTDGEGIFAYSLTAPEPGSVIVVEVEKPGFASKAVEARVSEDIIESAPDTIETTFVLGRAHEIESEFVARNLTLIPLTVESVELSAEFRDYVELSYDAGIIGKEVGINEDFNLSVLLSLKPRAIELQKPKNIEGSIIIKVSNPEIGREWLGSVGLVTRISFGDGVDAIDCLTVNPPVWEIVASGDVKKQVITLSNRCTVDDTPVALRGIEARLVGVDAETGTIEAVSHEGGVGKITLKPLLQRILNTLEENSEAQVSFEYIPQVSSGAEELEIEFVAVHNTARGPEKIKAKLALDVAVSLLAECIQIKPTKINITSSPYNTGFGNYGSRFGQGFKADGSYNRFDPYSTSERMGYQYGQQGDYTRGYGGYSSYGHNYGYSYPNQSYYPPGRDYGDYGGTYNMSWMGRTGRFDIINNCTLDAAISLDADDGILTAERGFDLAPNEAREIEVEPGYAIGLYKIEISAKPKESHESYQKLGEVKVNVESELLKTYRDCISIEPPKTLKFNSFIGKGTSLRIKNECYNQGVRLLESNNGIEFVEDADIFPGQPQAEIDRLIERWAYSDVDYDSTPDGKVVQEIKYRIVKSARYEQDAPKFVEPGKETPFETVGGLRYFLTRGYFAVYGDTVLKVNFFQRDGSRRSISFPLRIEDWWEALPFAERTIKFGDPNYTAKDCTITEALNFTDTEYPEPECIPYEELSGVFVRKAIRIAERTPKGDEKAGCGWADGITRISKTKFEKNGITVSLSLDDEKHSINVAVRGVEGRETIPATTFDEPVGIFVKRAYYNTEETRVPVRLKLCIKGREEFPKGVEIAKCPQGETGGGVHEKYGFEKLIFDWDWDRIKKDECDLANKFCDAAQFGISLNKKAAELKKIADIVRADETCASGDSSLCKERFRNSENIFRWALESFTVRNDIDKSNIVFFRGESEIVVPDDEAAKKVNDTAGSITAESDWSFVLQTETALQNLGKIDERKSILILLDKEPFSSAGLEATAEAIGLETQIIEGKEYYTMAFDEYSYFHRKIKEALDTLGDGKETAVTVKITTAQDVEKDITAAFMSTFNSAEKSVLIGITAEDSMEEGKKSRVMKEGKLKAGIDIAGYPDFLVFYNSIIKPDVQLIKDGYTADYRKDFAAEYSEDLEKLDTGVAFDKWVFSAGEKETLADTGEFTVNLNYSWADKEEDDSIKVSLVKSRGLAELQGENNYTLNSLFYMPFDGRLGYADKGRAGYGVGYQTDGKIGTRFFMNYRDEEENFGIGDIAKGLYSAVAGYGFGTSEKILQIGNEKITFTPTDPVYLKAAISKETAGSYLVGLIYYILVGNTEYTGNDITNLISWNVKENPVSGKKGAIADSPHRVSELCPGEGAENLLGIVFAGEAKGEIDMDGIIYVPTAAERADESQLVFGCIKDSAKITAKDVIADRVNSLTGKALPLNIGAKAGSLRLKEDYTLQKLIEKISDNSVCVASGSEGLTFYWNPKRIKDLGELSVTP